MTAQIDTSTEAVDAMATDLYDRVYCNQAIMLRALAAERDALRVDIAKLNHALEATNMALMRHMYPGDPVLVEIPMRGVP